MFSCRLLQRIYCICLCLSLVALCGCHQPGIQANVSNSTAPVQTAPAQPGYPPKITVQDLSQRIEVGDDSYWLIDVRTEAEVAIARIPTSTHIPIAQIADGSAIKQIRSERGDRQIILHCYSGVRSRRAQKHLAQAGIATTNLKGGIKAWRKQIDPSLPKKLLP